MYTLLLLFIFPSNKINKHLHPEYANTTKCSTFGKLFLHGSFFDLCLGTSSYLTVQQKERLFNTVFKVFYNTLVIHKIGVDK